MSTLVSEESEERSKEDCEVLFTRDLWGSIVAFVDHKCLLTSLNRISKWHHQWLGKKANNRIVRSVIKSSLRIPLLISEHNTTFENSSQYWIAMIDALFDWLALLKSDVNPGLISSLINRLTDHLSMPMNYDKNKNSIQEDSLVVDCHSILESIDEFQKMIIKCLFSKVKKVRMELSVQIHPPIDRVLRETHTVPLLMQIISQPLLFHPGSLPRPLDERRVFDTFDAPFSSDLDTAATTSIEDEHKSHHSHSSTVKSVTLMAAQLQFEAAWALTNIVSGDSEHVVKFVQMGGIDSVLRCLSLSSHTETCDQCIWCLGNISGDSPKLRDTVINSGFLEYLVANLDTFQLSAKRNAVWTMSNLVRGKPPPSLAVVKRLLPLALDQLQNTQDHDILVDLLWSLSFITEDRLDAMETREILALLLTKDDFFVMLNRLLSLTFSMTDPTASTQRDYLQAPVVRILGNIASAEDEMVTVMLDGLPFFRLMQQLLQTSRVRNIRKEACWALSNVVAGTPDQLRSFFREPGLLSTVVKLAVEDDLNVRKEAGWILANSCCGADNSQLCELVEAGFVQAMSTLLSTGEQKILRMACEGLSTLLSSLVSAVLSGEVPKMLLQRAQEICVELRVIEALERVAEFDTDAAAALTVLITESHHSVFEEMTGMEDESGFGAGFSESTEF